MTSKPIKARPTTYAGIQMRSRLEADYAAFLDNCGAEWTYEPQCYAGPAGQWLPDFQIAPNGPLVPPVRTTGLRFTEVKPLVFLSREGAGAEALISRVDELLTRMEMVWLSESDAFLDVVVWEYGAQAPRAIIFADGQSRIWRHYNPLGALLSATIWPGMGQMAAVIDSRRPASGPS